MLIEALRALLTGKPDARDCDLYYVRRGDHEGDDNLATLRILLRLRREEWRMVKTDLVAPLPLPNDLIDELGLSAADIAGVLQSLLGEVLSNDTDWSTLSQIERLHLLQRLHGGTAEDRARWRAMPLHQRDKGGRGCIDKRTVIADQGALPPELADEELVFLKPDEGLQGLYDDVPRLDRNGTLSIALERDRPDRFFSFILDNLLERGKDDTRVTLPDDPMLLCLLREMPWLPARDHGDGLAPMNLIDLPEAMLAMVRPLAAALGDYRLPDAVCPDIWRDARAVVHEILERPSRRRQVRRLATALDMNVSSFAERGEYFILPRKDDVSETLIRGCVEAPLEDVPGWHIVRAAATIAGGGPQGIAAVVAVARALCGPVSAKRQVETLTAISTIHLPKDSPVRLLYRSLIQSFARTHSFADFAEQVLPFIRVPTRDGWRLPCEVTARDSSVAPRHQLLKELCVFFPSDAEAQHHTEHGDRLRAGRHTDSVLRPYFEQWKDSLIWPAVGAFLSLLGDGNDGFTRNLAQEWLGDVDVALVRRELSPDDGGKCCANVHVFVSESVSGDYVSEVNLCGKTVPMLANKDNTIFAGGVRQEYSRGGAYTYWIVQLRTLDRNDHDEDDLLALLQGAVCLWADRALGLKHDDVLNWWKKWGKGSQVPIRPVRASILAHLPLTLRQLGVHECETLQVSLTAAERAQQRREQAGNSEIEPRAVAERAKLQKLGELIAEPAHSAFVRRRVRDSMERSGYSTESVLLELIQNADDALAQAKEIAAQSGRLLSVEARYVHIRIHEVTHTTTVDFKHFGRPINYTGGPAFQDRQWDQDLYFMMLLNLSAKPGEMPQHDVGSTTGRFGLGFKSVHLVSDSPSVVSGFGFAIDAGLVPNEMEVPDDSDLEPRGHHRPTRVRLPLRGDIDSDKLLDDLFRRFHPVRSLLPAFARGLSRVVVDGGRYSGVGAFDGVSIDAAPGWSVSRAEAELPGQGQWRLLRFRPGPPGTAAVMVGLRDGIPASLPPEVPFLWNVTPITDERWGCGYAINGPFKLDHGRTRVSLGDEDTLGVVDQLGTALGGGLVKLQHALDGDGNRPDGLPIDPTGVAKFIAELWKVLASGITDRDELHQAFLQRLHGSDRGISRWMSDCPVVSTELPAPFKEHLRPLHPDDPIERVEAGANSVELWAAMARIEEVAGLAAGHVAVSGSVANILHALGWKSRPLSASDILRALAKDWDNLLTPQRLHALRPLAQDDVWKLLEQQPGWHSDFRARSVTGEEVPMSNLLLPPREDHRIEWSMRDELRRARFAPDTAVLNCDYIREPEDVTVFCLLRTRHHVNAEKLADWLPDLDIGRQPAALLYLLIGDLRGPLLQKIVPRDQRPRWLADRDAVRRALKRLRVEPWRRESLLAALFVHEDGVDNDGERGDSPDQVDAKDFFGRLLEWWDDERVRSSVNAEFERAAWPQWLLTTEGGIGQALRSNSGEHWLALLVMGACRTIGRQSDESHRAFLQFLHDQGYWEVFKRSHANDESWMKVLRRYQDPAQGQLERSTWMSLFPIIYQCNRYWTKYRNTLRSAGHRPPDKYNFNWLLAPRVDPHLTGSGQNFDAPPLPMDVGRHWILRELVRLNVIRGKHLLRDCWVPSEQVIRLLCRVGMAEPDPDANSTEKARVIFDFLKRKLNEQHPHLHYSFDIPLRHVAKYRNVLMVDEAHHMNVEEREGKTLAFQLVEQLQTSGRIQSLVLFTGTPHRGKDFGFLSLLKLLRPTEFDPRRPLEAQVGTLRDVMIRNNKQRITDMQGNRVFEPVKARRETYTYSAEESRFYDRLTEFIVSGRAYASTRLDQPERRKAMLVLITMQKLASSSITAVRRALHRRLGRLRGTDSGDEAIARYAALLDELLAEDDPANMDIISRLEERIAGSTDISFNLDVNEIAALEELVSLADQVVNETKIEHIIGVVTSSFSGRSVLFFTEYKATQALLMSALQERFGDGCVTFINGDGFVDEVRDSSGRASRLTEDRRHAADRFNRGDVRFLVSTEAAGEGIDLQENCNTLIHVDLPWNPMRLHQRVGRLSRYGQKRPVDVLSVRNPDTVEGRVWECLDEKLDRITLAFQGGMDDPEDMRELVIGMGSPRMYSNVFANASRRDRLEQWFNAETATFGGEDAVRTVQSLVGNVARFDFGEVADQIPRVDLPELVPFVKSIFAVLRRGVIHTDGPRLSFKTPPEWRAADFAIVEHYELVFARDLSPREGEDVAGVGHRVMDHALRTAADATDALAALGGLAGPLVVFGLRDRITGSGGAVRKVVVGMLRSDDLSWQLLRDWEVLKLLNPAADKPRSGSFRVEPQDDIDVPGILSEAERCLKSRTGELDLPFRVPEIEQIACLVPGRRAR